MGVDWTFLGSLACCLGYVALGVLVGHGLALDLEVAVGVGMEHAAKSVHTRITKTSLLGSFSCLSEWPFFVTRSVMNIQ